MKVKYNYTLYNNENPYGKECEGLAIGDMCKKPSYICGCDNGYIFIRTKTNKIHIIEIDKIISINDKTFLACCLNCGRYYSDYGFYLCKKHDETMENPQSEKCEDYIMDYFL